MKTDGTRIRVLTADDHPVVRAGIAAMLANEPDLVVVAEAAGELGWGSEAVGTAVWSGVRLADVLAQAVPGAEARHVEFTGLDQTEREGRSCSLRFEPRTGQALRSLSVSALLALPDGALWIGYHQGGVSSLVRGWLTSWPPGEGLPSGTVTAFARDWGGRKAASSGTYGMGGGKGGAKRGVLCSSVVLDRNSGKRSKLRSIMTLPR